MQKLCPNARADQKGRAACIWLGFKTVHKVPTQQNLCHLKMSAGATTFCCPLHHDDLFPTKMTSPTFCCLFFGCWPNWRTKKAARLFAVLLVTFWRPKLEKGQQKVMQLFILSSKRMPKRHQKVAELILSSIWLATFFGRQKVAYGKRTAKSHGTCIQLE